jgi:hypothetical protein
VAEHFEEAYFAHLNASFTCFTSKKVQMLTPGGWGQVAEHFEEAYFAHLNASFYIYKTVGAPSQGDSVDDDSIRRLGDSIRTHASAQDRQRQAEQRFVKHSRDLLKPCGIILE